MLYVMQPCGFSFYFLLWGEGGGILTFKFKSLGFSHREDLMVIIEIQLVNPRVFLEDNFFLDKSDVVCDAAVQL